MPVTTEIMKEEVSPVKTKSTDTLTRNKNIVRIMLVTVLILMVPLIAMQLTDEVKWGPADFAVIGTLLVGTGLVYELAVKRVKNTTYRVVLAALLVAALLLVWAELAVGIFGTPFAGE